jgi:hypothetical protein
MDSQNKEVQEQSPSDHPADGRQLDRSYRATEEFRAICEARFVLAHPVSWRREYLADVGKIRGDAARQYLEGVIRTEWGKRKAPAKGG